MLRFRNILTTFFRKNFSRLRPRASANASFCNIGSISDHQWGGPDDIRYCKNVKEEVIIWLTETFGPEGERWFIDTDMLLTPHPRGGSVYSGSDMVTAISFMYAEDLILFKLTWMGV